MDVKEDGGIQSSNQKVRVCVSACSVHGVRVTNMAHINRGVYVVKHMQNLCCICTACVCARILNRSEVRVCFHLS